MKTYYRKLFSIKFYIIAVGLFIVLTSTTNSASSQTANIASAPDPDFSGNNMSETIGGGWIKWKLSGTWFDQDGLYVFDTWTDLGLGVELTFNYIARQGSSAGSATIQNINTSGYGILDEGTHILFMSYFR